MTTEQTAAPTAEANGAPPMTWNEAAAEADAARVEREIVEDVIDVKLTDADLADIARANAADDHEKTQRQRDADELRAELKEAKGSIDALVARMHDRNNAVLKGVQARKAAWIRETVFSTNTVRFLDPASQRVVLERPLRQDERQVKLPLEETPKKSAGQMSLGEEDDQRADDVTDPDALLEAAQASPSDVSLENEPDGEDDFEENEVDGDDE